MRYLAKELHYIQYFNPIFWVAIPIVGICLLIKHSYNQ